VNHLADALSEVQSPAFGQPHLRAGLQLADPWNSYAATSLQQWILKHRTRRQLFCLTGDLQSECVLSDTFGNKRVIDPLLDYTIADLYDASGALLP